MHKRGGAVGRGFTLVELLIVIVIIAILAAITIVAYNGIQQRADNTSIKAQATEVAKLLQLYETGEGAYPVTSGAYCLTLDDDCQTYSGDPISDTSYRSNLINPLKKYGSIPQSVPHPDDKYYGLSVTFSTKYTLNGQPTPVLINFFLKGTNQDCTGIAGMTSVADNGTQSDGSIDMKPQSYSNQNVKGSGVTRCYEMFTPK